MYPSPKYKVQKIADKFESGSFNIKIRFLPVAHSEINPIEMVWARVRHLTFQVTAVEEETKRRIEKVAVDDFNKCYKHSIL